MNRPPRKKDAPIINQRLITRVLFSAAMIILGVSFIYLHELSDGSMSRRDQTMVSQVVGLLRDLLLTTLNRLLHVSSSSTWFQPSKIAGWLVGFVKTASS